MKKYFTLLLFTLIAFNTLAQQSAVYGTVTSAKDPTGLPGATVVLEKRTVASATPRGVVTDLDGKFRIAPVDTGQYNLKIQFVGFEVYTKVICVQASPLNIGTIELKEYATTLKEVEVIGKVPPAEQKGDTTQYYAAAFKTAPDANAQDLIEKMPGITVQDGKLQAQGEEVQQILIDGKPFFGGDVNAALQSLPAEMIASIEVFDQLSDQARLSGFDDGERLKTINIITKPNRRKGQFGRASAGYGTNDRYLGGASVNIFNEERKITVTGVSNNINTLNYSSDLSKQADTRTQNGLINTHSVGLNYIDTWGKKANISGNYSYTQRQNISNQLVRRDFISASDSGRVYSEESINANGNGSHRADMRLEYNINERNRILIRPDMTLRHNRLSSQLTGQTDADAGEINRLNNSSNSDNLDYDIHNRMYYSHKFLKPGRSINVNLNTSIHYNEDDSYRQASTTYFSDPGQNRLLNQYTRLDRKGMNWSTRTSYTEPVGKNGALELEYKLRNSLNDSDKRTYDIAEDVHNTLRLDTAISNTFNSNYLAQEFEIGYQYKTEKLRLQVETQYQRARLLNDQVFPQSLNMDRLFHSILPLARVEYRFTKNSNVELNYRAWTAAPSIGQLQQVIDNSNPLQLRTGNQDLDQAYTHWMQARYRSQNPNTNRSLFAQIQSNIVHNYIANSTFTASQPTEIAEGVVLDRGSQLIRPVNVNGYYEVRSYLSFGQPVKFLKSNFHVNSSINHTRRPGLINNEVNMANTSNFRLGMSLSSNISEKIDFMISTRSSYNRVENSLREGLNNFYNQSTRLRYNWILKDGLVFRTDFNHQVNKGLAKGFDNNFLLWNMSVGKKVFRNRLGEVSLNVYDLLGQNNNIRRNINEVFVEDFQSNVLQRYFMLTFTYNIRHFSKGTSEEDYRSLHKS